MKNVQTAFFSFHHDRTTFSEFAVKHGRDPRFKTIEKMKDREAIFIEFMTAMRKREKEDSKSRGEKVSLKHHQSTSRPKISVGYYHLSATESFLLDVKFILMCVCVCVFSCR